MSIEPGDWLKVSRYGHRFWTEVVSVFSDHVKARVDTSLVPELRKCEVIAIDATKSVEWVKSEDMNQRAFEAGNKIPQRILEFKKS